MPRPRKADRPMGNWQPVKSGRNHEWVAPRSKQASVNTPQHHGPRPGPRRNPPVDHADRQQRKAQHRQRGGQSRTMSTFGQPSAFGAPSRPAPTSQPSARPASRFSNFTQASPRGTGPPFQLSSSQVSSPFGQPSAPYSGFGAPSGFPKPADEPPRASSPFDRLAKPAAKPANPFATQPAQKKSGWNMRTAPGLSNPSSNNAPNTHTATSAPAQNPFASNRMASTTPFGGAAKPATPAFGTSPFAQMAAKAPSGFGQPAKVNSQARAGQPTERGSKRKNEFADPASSKRHSPEPSDAPSVGSGAAFSHLGGNQDSKRRRNPFPGRDTAKKPSPGPVHGSRTNEAANGAPADYAKAIYDQLRRDDVRPPRWPAEPGNPSNRQAMEDFRDAYKQYQGRVRTSLIKAGLIDDPDVRKKLADAINFRGICEGMCPEFEKISRIVEYDIKHPEKEKSPDGLSMWPSPDRMVKAFKRSAAGMEAPLPTEVLSPAALRRTVDYLIDDLLRDDERLPALHSFLWDRTRAVRKDFIFQNAMTPEERRDQIYCLETIARFHATALHLLSEEGVAAENFSQQQEREQLGKSLLSLIQAYDETANDGLGNENEAEFRAYYILFNAHDPFVKQQVQEWGSTFWFDSDEVQTAVSLIEALQNVWRGRGPLKPQAPLSTASTSFTTYFSIVENPAVSYTMACFAEIHFTELRQHLLRTINKAFGRIKDNPKDLTAEAVNNILRFDNTEECIEFLELHDMQFSTVDATEPYLVVDRRRNIPAPTVKQSFSGTLVERKRGDRSLPEVIHTTVFEEDGSESAPAGKAQEIDSESMFLPQPGEHLAAQLSSKSPPASLFAPPASTTAPTGEKPNSPAASNGSILGKQTQPAEPEKTLSAGPLSLFAGPSKTAENSAGAGGPAPSTQPPEAPSIVSDKPAVPPAAPKFPWSQPAGRSEATAPAGASIFPWTSGPGQPGAAVASTSGTKSSSVFGSLKEPQATSPFPSISADGQVAKKAPDTSSQAAPTVDKTPSASTASTPAPTQPATSTSPFGQSPAASKEQPAPTLASTTSGGSLGSGATMPGPTSSAASPFIFQTPATASQLIQSTQAPTAAAQAPAAAPVPPSVAPKQKPQDLMGRFAKWFVQGDGGIMEQFTENFLENLVQDVYDAYKREQEEQQRKEEDEQSWAEALKWRRYNLGLKFFYRWRANARKLAMKRIGREGRVAVKAWREAKAAEAKAAKEKVARDEQARLKRLNDGSIIEEFQNRAAKKARRSLSRRSSSNESLEEALLATGIFSGLANEREAAARCAKDTDSLHEALIRPLPNMRQSTSALGSRPKDSLRPTGAGVTKSTAKPGESKKMRMIRELYSGRQPPDEEARSVLGLSRSRSSSFRHSLPAGGRVTNFTKYQRTTPRSSVGTESSEPRRRSGVKSDYWRLKARGLITMPNGLALHESLAIPMIEDGIRYPGIGDYGLGPAPSSSQAEEAEGAHRRTPPGGGAFRGSVRLTGARRSTGGLAGPAWGSESSSFSQSVTKPAEKLRLTDGSEGDDAETVKPSEEEAQQQRQGKAPRAQYDWQVGLEQTLREVRELGEQMDETTEWLREQNERMSKAGTPWDV